MIEIQQTYKLKTTGSDRKEAIKKNASLKETYTYMRNGETYFFNDVCIPLYAGLNSNIISSVFPSVKNEHMDLLLSTFWFRSMPIKGNRIIVQPVAEKKLADYLGREPSHLALQYLRTQNNENNGWVDCCELYNALCSKLNVKNLEEELIVLLREKCLPIAIVTETKNGFSVKSSQENNNPISIMFGTGNKEDRANKINLLKQIADFISNNPNVDVEKLSNAVLRISNSKNVNEFKFNYKKSTAEKSSGGRHSKFVEKTINLLNNEKLGNWKDFLPTYAQSINEEIQNKSHGTDVLYNVFRSDFLRLIEKSIWGERDSVKYNIEYNVNVWGQMFGNAMASIRSKNISNFNLAIDQFKRIEFLNSNVEIKNYANILNQYFDSEFFNENSDTFVIESQHLGNNLKSLFSAVEKDDSQSAVDAFCDDFKGSFDRMPINSILKYILSVREKLPKKHQEAAEVIERACKYNFLNDKVNRTKVNPTVVGNSFFTFGKSGLNGKVILPKNAEFKDRELSPDMRIWCELRLLDHGKWVTHHIPTFNNRFIREVYAPGTNDSVLPIRSPIYGFDYSKIKLSNAQREKINLGKSKNEKFILKRQMQFEAAREQGLLPKVNCNNLSVVWNMQDNKAIFSVIHKYEIDFKDNLPKDRKIITIGDKIFGWDRNQTSYDTYTIIEVMAEDTGITYNGHFVKIVQTGFIQQNIKLPDGTNFDTLSYEGLSYTDFFDWRVKGKNFMHKMGVGIKPVRTRNEGIKYEEINFVQEFEQRIEQRKPSLYEYNKIYAYLLKDVVNCKPNEMQEIREEIFRFLTSEPVSPINRGSLNYMSFDMIKAGKNLIAGYFSKVLGHDPKNSISDEDKQNYDGEMFALRQKLEQKRKNKGKQKVDILSNAMIKIAKDKNCNIMVGEGKLLVASRKTKSSQNGRTMDWFSRAVGNKMQELVKRHNKHLVLINPIHTSHQDTFEHKKDGETPAMRARYTKINTNEISDFHVRKLVSFYKNKERGTTGIYYYDAVHDFLNNYNIKLEEFLGILKIKEKRHLKLKQLLEERIGKECDILMPMRGGRFYLSTHAIGECNRITCNNKEYWLCHADLVASTNIALSIFLFKS